MRFPVRAAAQLAPRFRPLRTRHTRSIRAATAPCGGRGKCDPQCMDAKPGAHVRAVRSASKRACVACAAQHIYGGIPAGVVIEERVVRRASDGTYLAIEGLCEADAADIAPAASSRSALLAAGLALAALAGVALLRR
jgi:hypothetical protein